MTRATGSPWWKALLKGGSPSDEDEASGLLVDPTSVLLRQITQVESRIPWGLVGVLVIVLLWIPTLLGLSGSWDGAVGPVTSWEGAAPGPEQTWAGRILGDAPRAEYESEAVRKSTRLIWRALGVEGAPESLGADELRRLRIPPAIFSLFGLLVLYALARRVAGNAAGLLAVSFVATSQPWGRAGTIALPLMIGEAVTLLGVTYAIALQSRHREVEVPGASAIRIGVAGLLIGIGLLLAPANFATFLAVVTVWLFLALSRTNSDLTTLPVKDPAVSTFVAILGTIVVIVATGLAGWGAERLAGGHGFPYLAGLEAHLDVGMNIWQSIWRGLFSPSVTTDRLILVAIPVIAGVRIIEWSVGRLWRAAGLLPWVFFALFLHTFVIGRAEADSLVVPMTVPPLFMLGVGWLILRGLGPNRSRRQEYSFLLVWLGVVLATVPFIPSTHPNDPLLASFLVLMPPVLIVAARAGRALWEADESVLARIACFLLLYLPVIGWAVTAIGRFTPPGSPFAAGSAAFTGVLPLILMGTVTLGALAEMIGVRPDAALVQVRPGGRPAGRRGGGRRSDSGEDSSSRGDRDRAGSSDGSRGSEGRSGRGSRGSRGNRGGRGGRSNRSGGGGRDGSAEGGSRKSGGRSSGQSGNRGGGSGGSSGSGGRGRRGNDRSGRRRRRDGGSR